MSTATLSAQERENARINAENERLRKQATRKRRIGLGFSYFALILITILMIFPLLIVVLVSFTPNAITQTWPPKLIPSQFTLENYQSLFKRLPIGREMLNTVIFAGAVTIISVFFDSLAAYGLSRVNFKGRGLLLGVLIATMMIPGMALLIPVYKLPAILTVGMFNFMGNWNDLLWPLIMTSKPETRTITAGLAMLTGHGSSVTPYGVVMAGALISALPLLVVFFLVQKRFVEGIAMTGMK